MDESILIATPITIEGEPAYSCKYGTITVHETRFGLHRSVDAKGNGLITALTEAEVVHGTPMHLYANSSDYKGEFDSAKFSSTVGGKL